MVESLKERVFTFIRDRDHVSFVELGREFPEFMGGDFSLQVRENNVMWVNMTENAVEAIQQLREEGKIVAIPSSLLVYLADGMCLKFPLAKRAGPYKTPHWGPVTWRAFEHCSPKVQRLVRKARAAAGDAPI